MQSASRSGNLKQMRLTGSSEDEALDEVWAYLTAAEATALYEALRFYLEEAATDPADVVPN